MAHPRTQCPLCGKTVAYRRRGKLFAHTGGNGIHCHAGNFSKSQLAGRVTRVRLVQEVTDELRRCWRIGDAWKAADILGIQAPVYTSAECADLDGELSHMTSWAKNWIVDTVRLAIAQQLLTLRQSAEDSELI